MGRIVVAIVGVSLVAVSVFLFLEQRRLTRENNALATNLTKNEESVNVPNDPEHESEVPLTTDIEEKNENTVSNDMPTNTEILNEERNTVLHKDVEEMVVKKDANTTPTVSTNISNIQQYLPCVTLLSINGGREETTSLTPEEEKEILEQLNNQSNNEKLVTATDVCVFDKLISNNEIKVKTFQLYVKNINKKYSIDLLSLSSLDRLSKVMEYEKYIASERDKFELLFLSIINTVKEVYLCLAEEGTLSEPKDGEKLCSLPLSGEWPEINRYDMYWGGCEMEVNKDDLTFKYCFTSLAGVVTCTQEGCN